MPPPDLPVPRTWPLEHCGRIQGTILQVDTAGMFNLAPPNQLITGFWEPTGTGINVQL